MAAKKLGTQIRREQIVRAALQLVAKEGLQKLNMAAVARQVGLVPSALYRHFQNKSEIIDAVLGLLRSQMMGNVEKARSEFRDPEEQLRRLLELHTELIQDNQAIPRILFSDDVYTGPPERKRHMYEVLKGYLDAVAGIVREGQEAGRFHKDLDPDTLALMFIGIVVPAAILWHAGEGRLDLAAHTDRGWQVFRNLLKGP